jgi:phosphohistidine phosphatase SixA
MAEPSSVRVSEAAARLSAEPHLLFMRHEQTVAGVGDPPGFKLDDCATQRNLSQAGRARAEQAGERMRQAGIVLGVVRSSRWCRAQDTARLAFGRVEVWASISSFFAGQGDEAAQSRAVREFASNWTDTRHAMLVTHQVNISALLGVYPQQGEVVAALWRDGALRAQFRFHPVDSPQ